MNKTQKREIVATLLKAGRRDLASQFAIATRLTLGPGVRNDANTKALQSVKKLAARNKGDFASAIQSAGYYAKKYKKVMYLYEGSSYMHIIWRVSEKPGDYLNPINNTGATVLSVTPDLEVAYHPVHRAS